MKFEKPELHDHADQSKLLADAKKDGDVMGVFAVIAGFTFGFVLGLISKGLS